MTAIRRDFGGEQFIIGDDTVTGDDIARLSSAGKVVNSTASTLTLTALLHAGRVVTINRAAGTAITLPAATGTGDIYTIIIGTTVSSNTTTIKAASASDSFTGFAYGADDDGEGATGYTWKADSGDDTITLSGAATGGKAGDKFIITDYASGVFQVTGFIKQSGGSEATPFSATVS